MLLLSRGFSGWVGQGWVFVGTVGNRVEGVAHLDGYCQSELGDVFNQGDAFVGQIEEGDHRTEHAGRADHLRVQQMRQANEGEDEDFAAYASDPDRRADAAFIDGGEDSGDVVGGNEDDQGINEAVETSHVNGEPRTKASEAGLNGVPRSVERHEGVFLLLGASGNKEMPSPDWVKVMGAVSIGCRSYMLAPGPRGPSTVE